MPIIDLPPEAEYHLRAGMFAAFMTTAIAKWSDAPNDNFYSNCAWTFALCHAAALFILWWRVPNGSLDMVAEAIKKLLKGRPANGAKNGH